MSIQRASSYSPLSDWKYEVFLSFRGEDTRKSFIDHLFAALNRRGIIVFKDDKKLEKGKSISPQLSKAIEKSRISIVVFSRNYASSTWCLEELVYIVHCMDIMKQMVIPIFYGVDPSVVRKQKKNYQKVFAKHEEAFRENIEKVQKWRTALTKVANLCGWDLKDRHEYEFIQDIVKDISKKLCSTTLRPPEGLVGIDSRLEKLRRIVMGTNSDDVCMIGIYGMGGIGKTTLARAVYDLISCEFEGSSFLANVKEMPTKQDLVRLQKQLLSQILREEVNDIWDVYDGIERIKRSLWHKKVLIVIDDINDIKQLNELIGEHKWFAFGSRILITTRDKHLLMVHEVDKMYKVEELDEDDALQLFSLKAFKNYNPSKEYEKLSKCFVKYACGLPLALEVLGSLLFGRTIDEWKSALERLGRDYEKGIHDCLQISYDELKETEQQIFLDVACFFKGKNKNHVIRILDGCGFNPTIGISILVDRSLITISDYNILWMHDLLQEMGQQIVKRESQAYPGKRSRLWEEVDVHDVLVGNTGTEVVQGLIVENDMQHLSVSAEAFSMMTNLRLLKISNVQLSKGLEYISNKLRLLEWHGYPLKFLPTSLQLNNTVELKMHYSHIEQLWKETKPLNKLKVISLFHSKNLSKTPNFTVVPNLEELVLEGCTKLREIHPSLLVHKKLILLNLRDCTSLTALPNKMDMESLKTLMLSGCKKLKTFPEIVQSLVCLSELFLDETPIKELPFPVELLNGIVLLSLKGCNNLLSLPSNINGLKYLKTLELSGCSKLENVPENLAQVECLEKLDLSGTAIRKPVSSIFFMKNLKDLSFRGCKGPPPNALYMPFPFSLMSRRNTDTMDLMLPPLLDLCSLTKLDLSECNLGEGGIFNEISCLVLLKELHLENSNITSLPASISRLSKLEILCLDNSKRLQSLPELPSNLGVVKVDNCTSLETFPNSLKSGSTWICISCVNCSKLLDYSSATFSQPKELIPNSGAEVSNIVIPGSEVPNWFRHQRDGSSIRIKPRPDLKLKGYFACAVLFSSKHLPAFTSLCEFQSYTEVERGFCIFIRSSANGILSDHLWLIYLPIQSLHHGPQKNWYHCEFDTSRCPDVIVKRCAVHLIYEEVEEVDHATDRCSGSVSGNLIEVQNDFVETSKIDVASTSGIGQEP